MKKEFKKPKLRSHPAKTKGKTPYHLVHLTHFSTETDSLKKREECPVLVARIK